MEREGNTPILVVGFLAAVAVLALCWWAFLSPRGGTDPRLEQKALELKQRRQTVAPPAPQ